MSVKLISYTQPTIDMILDGVEDIQELVAYCARVSNPSNQMNKETSEKLIKYLIKHDHWSPLEMVNVCLEIDTTRDIAHQIVRHRSFSFQEFSQRYAEPSSMGDCFVTRECRLQDTKNRQNSVELDEHDELHLLWEDKQKEIIEKTKQIYEWAINNGIAKEQARAILPEGCTKTRLYMNGTLRSWLHYIDLRSSNGTQKEHMIVARECADVIARIFPMIWELEVDK
jgi:thymidylate synthase (FAD)|tara:strand:+ start:477 stop:1154 length:678 start_codon:yes stop_codon:yes gene_type:complete